MALKHKSVISILVLIYFVSGACSLIDEVVWARLLKLSIGNTVYASSVVVSVFMGGLAIGAWLMGRWGGRIKRPLPVYAGIELLITVLVLLSPKAIGVMDAFYRWLWQTAHPSHAVLIVVQTVLSALVLLCPTILMGSTLPLLARVVAKVKAEAGSLVGRLYALNTLGAALGCFLAGFVLIRSVGVMETLYIAGFMNLGVALSAYLLHRLSGELQTIPAVPEPVERVPEPPMVMPSGSGRLTFLAVGFFFSGLACIAYELMWMRSIVHSMGAFTYVFSAVLTVYLIGNVMGTAIASAVVRTSRNPGAVYAGVFLVLGLCGVLYIPWLHLCNFYILPWASDRLRESLIAGWIPWRMMRPMIQSVILFLGPSLVMGFGFPFMVQAWVQHVHHVGRTVGFAYSMNTLGAVLGGLVTGFVGIPLLGLQRAVIVTGLSVMWISAVMWWALVQPARHRMLTRSVLPLAALFVTFHVAWIPRDLFNRSVALSSRRESFKVIDVKTGINTTVSIHRDTREGDTFLYTSGRMVAGTSPGYRGDQKMLGHFPALLNQYADSVLSVGFGTGESTACLSKHGIARNDCAEIAPEVVDLSLKYFKDLNLGDEHTKRVNIIYMDARNYLHLTEQRYDVIVNDCTSIRGFAENSSLYTREYFECAKKHLNPHGLFMSWIDTYSTEGQHVVDTLLGTVMDVFPHVTLWYMMPEPAPFFVIVGSVQPQTFSIRHIQQELDKPAVRESLAKISMVTSQDVMSCYIADERDIRRYLKDYTVNTDDRPFIEFCTEDKAAGRQVQRRFYEVVRSGSVLDHMDWTGLETAEQTHWLEAFARLRKISDYVLLAQTSTTYSESLGYCVKGLAMAPGHPALAMTKQFLEDELMDTADKALKDGDMIMAERVADTILKHDPNAACAWILQSQIAYHRGDIQQALETARRALDQAPDDLEVQYNLWSLLIAHHGRDAALDIIQRALQSHRKSPALPRKRFRHRIGF